MRASIILPKILILPLLLFLFSKASVGQESENFIIKLDGERIELYNPIKLSQTHVYFDNSDGKDKWVKQKQVEVMLVNNRLFLNLPVTSVSDRLQEIIAFNSEYILTGFWDDILFVYIWDKNFNPLEKKITFPSGFKKHVRKNHERMTESVIPYFGNCPELIEILNKNIDNRGKINEGVSYFNCDGVLNPLEIYLEMNK